MNEKLIIKSALKKFRKEMELYVCRQGKQEDMDGLNCMCGISTYVLFIAFNKLGYRPVFCMNDDHCFLRVGPYWIDLTLKQFNTKCPKIYFRKKPYTTNDGYGNVHRSSEKARTIYKMKRMFRRWPKDQNPFKCKGLPFLKEAA